MAQTRHNPLAASSLSYHAFGNLYLEHEDAAKALPQAIEALAQEQAYEKIESILLIHLDHLDGVKSSVVDDSNKYLTGLALIRDAKQAKPLSERNQSLSFNADSFLLRALSTLRSVHFILQTIPHSQSIQSELSHALAKTLQRVIQLQNNVSIDPEAHQHTLQKLETDFNAMLFEKLQKSHFANTPDIHEQQKIEKVLLHLRNIGSLLSPAKVMQTTLTKTYETPAHETIKITLTETAHPITLKTPSQKMALAKLGQKMDNANVFQAINQAFADLSQLDDRRYPAQTRKTISPTVKNGYFTQTQMDIVKDGNHIATEQYSALRCGSLVYIGKTDASLNEKDIARDTQDNMEQLERAKALHKIPAATKTHIAMLLTYTPLQSQQTIIDGTQAANPNTHYLPLNVDGTARMLWVKPSLQPELDAAGISSAPTPLDRVKRITRVGQVINLLINKEDAIPLITCASGQDRTGTASEASNVFWVDDQLKKHGIPLTQTEIKEWRATGLHNVMLASLAAPGSPGMKSDSQPSNTLLPNLSGEKHFFTPAINAAFYRKTANTNKKVAVKDHTKNHLIDIFEQTKWAITQSNHSDEVFSLLNAYIHMAKLYQADKISATNSVVKSFNSLFRPAATPIRNQVNRILSTHYALTLEGGDPALLTHMKKSLNQEQGNHSDETMGLVFRELRDLLGLAETQLVKLQASPLIAAQSGRVPHP